MAEARLNPKNIRTPAGTVRTLPQLAPAFPPRKPKGKVLSKEERELLVNIASMIAEKHGIPPKYFITQIQQESGFNPTARGKAGEIGIAQIIPRLHPGVNPHDPIQSMDYMASFIQEASNKLAMRYGPDMAFVAAAAAWNAGLPSVEQGKIPITTLNYIASIFGVDVARELARRASNPQPVNIPLSRKTPPQQPPDSRLRLATLGLLLSGGRP